MPIKSQNGLVHVIKTRETPSSFGTFLCGSLYTFKRYDTQLKFRLVHATSDTVTCLYCTAAERRRRSRT